jgi:hypothetical protein
MINNERERDLFGATFALIYTNTTDSKGCPHM